MVETTSPVAHLHVTVSAADVLTIENSRSGDAMVVALASAGYSKDLGPGVYDVHSPQVKYSDSLLIAYYLYPCLQTAPC